MANIDTTHLDSGTDKIKLARPALKAMASFINKLFGYETDDITTEEKEAARSVLGVLSSADGAVGAGNLADDAVETDKLADAAVTLAKVATETRGVPQNAKSANYTLAIDDNGKHIFSANSEPQTITIPTNATVAIPVGTAVSIVNNGTAAITISAAGVTLKQAGTTNTGNRTLGVNGMVTLVKVQANTWFAAGAGLT